MSKFRKVMANVGKSVAFVAVFLALLALIMNVLEFKQEDGTLPVHNYYELPADTVDVLVLGSSHAGMNVSTRTMFDEYGIAGYRLWGSIQPVWNSYYYLKEAVKTQSPKVVILDVHSVTFEQEYGTYPVQVKNTIAMRPSREKIENIWASVPEADRANMLFGFPTYHNRYDQLTEDDFEYFPWNRHQEIQVLSSEVTDHIYPFNILDKDATTGDADLGQKEEKYFRMLIEYCQANGLNLELVASPYEITESEQKKFRRIGAIAAEYGIDFTNFNEFYREIGIDPQVDYLDPGHFNKTGMPKYARALAEMLKSKYDLPDRRKDPNHIWNRVRAAVAEPTFALTEQKRMDGIQDYFDTEMKLYENPLASWTLCADFTLPEPGDEEKVVMACFDDVGGKGGLKVSRTISGDLAVAFGTAMDSHIQNPTQDIRLVVIKMGQMTKIYINGEIVEDRKLDQDQLAQYDGTLMLGCEIVDQGRRTHFGHTLIRDLVIYDTALNEDDALAWTPSELPEPEAVDYLRPVTSDDLLISLEHRYEGNGDVFIDTGVQLFEEPEASFTLLSRIDPTLESGDSVYFSCFSEELNAYRGLLVRRLGNGVINILYGNATGVNLDIPTDVPSTLVIVKDRSAYTIWLNGEKVVDQDVSTCAPYDGTFLVGCELDADGNVFRQSGTTVYNLEVYRGMMPEADILAWNPEPLEVAPKAPGMNVDYVLREGFVGNGLDACVDTGIMLYDNPDKDWTLSFVIEQITERKGSVVSCFDETPGKYRGLLVRQMDETHFNLVTGTQSIDVEIHPATRLHMTIVKQGSLYRVYVDGELVAERESTIAAYLGNLYIGSERNRNGKPFRFSDVSVRRLEVSGEAMDDAAVAKQARAWKERTK